MNGIGRRLAQLFSFRKVSPPKIIEGEKPAGQSKTLTEWRAEMIENRTNIINRPGMYLDTGATGTGKSTGDIEICRRVKSGLIVSPTIENCEEIEKDMQAAGLDAKRFPGRLTEGDETNCWNPSADTAEEFGLSAVAAVCSGCPHRAKCINSGYLGQLVEVKQSAFIIATHARAKYTGIDKLASGREFVSIHEDCADVLCPDEALPIDDIISALTVLMLILNDPAYLNWLGQSATKDDDGVWTPDEKLAERRSQIDKFVRHLADVIEAILKDSESVEKTRKAVIPSPIKKAPGTDSLLFRASLELLVSFLGAAWRVLLAAAAGDLYSLAWIVDTDHKGTRKILAANWRNIPTSDNASILFNDATSTQEDIEDYTGKPVIDITPTGHIERSKRAVQIPKDISRRTKAAPFLAMIRGILNQFPVAEKVGVITHRTLETQLKKIGGPYSEKIGKTTYFGQGSDRASNEWYQQHDLIIVAGTPRVPGVAVQRRLIQFGDYGPASENPDWGDVLWRGQTESGKEVIVKNRGYRHPVWARAHRSLVRAALVQAAGRARSLLETGCDVVIVSTEECGFPLAEQSLESVSQANLDILSAIKRLSLVFLPSDSASLACAYNISKRTQAISDRPAKKRAISTTDVSRESGLSEQRTRAILSDLEQRGFVSRLGQRGGWFLTANGEKHCPEVDQSSPSSTAASSDGCVSVSDQVHAKGAL